MSITKNIPNMDDNRLSVLFFNAQKLISEGKRLEEAKSVVQAVQTEWRKRLEAFRQGGYRADTPEEGVLKTVGYKVGNDGIGEAMRHQLLDFVMTGTLPPVGSPAHMEEWGEPHSTTRYRKLHRVIRVLASSGKHFENMRKAVQEWEDDLLYLEHRWHPQP